METTDVQTTKSKLEDFYVQLIASQQRVADIFISFFGDSCVDYQKPDKTNAIFWASRQLATRPEASIKQLIDASANISDTIGIILVYFPEVTVTNERGESIDITKLFVRTKITSTGCIYSTFDMTRSEYTIGQYRAGYIHSHCSHIPNEGGFASCCLGTGPIRHTISLLTQGFDEDRWNLYCFELSEYVKVESLSGIPYNNLRNVSNGRYSPQIIRLSYDIEYPLYLSDWTLDFWKDYIERHPLPLSFCNGCYSLAIPPATFMREVSEEYLRSLIDNESRPKDIILRNHSELFKGIYIDDTFHNYTWVTDNNSNSNYGEGDYVCTFKGTRVRKHIILEDRQAVSTEDILLNPRLINDLLTRTLFLINYGTTENSHQISKEFRIL